MAYKLIRKRCNKTIEFSKKINFIKRKFLENEYRWLENLFEQEIKEFILLWQLELDGEMLDNGREPLSYTEEEYNTFMINKKNEFLKKYYDISSFLELYVDEANQLCAKSKFDNNLTIKFVNSVTI